MGLIVKPYTFVNGTVADADEVNADIDTLYSMVNGNINEDNLASDSVGRTEVKDDAIGEDEIDWGTGADQVSAADVPIADAGSYYVNGFVEGALQEISVGTELNTWKLSRDDVGPGAFSMSITHAPLAAAARIATIPESLADAYFVMTEGDQTINGVKTLTTPHIRGAGAGDAILQFTIAAADQTFTLPDETGTIALVSMLPPVGSIHGFNDFNGTVSINTTYYRFCDGTVLNYAASPLNGVTLDDLSNRILVGFGTEAGGNIATAGTQKAITHFANAGLGELTVTAPGHGFLVGDSVTISLTTNYNCTATVNTIGANVFTITRAYVADDATGLATLASNLIGNANHQIALNHTHGALGVTASGGESSHTHASGTLRFVTIVQSNSNFGTTFDINGVAQSCFRQPVAFASTATLAAMQWYTMASNITHYTGGGSGSSGSGSSHTHDINHTHASALSATQSIMMRSVRTRFIVRVL